MSTTITALTAILAGNLDDTAVFAADDANANTRKVTVAQLRTQLLVGLTVPAAQVSAGTFGAGAYTFPSTLTVTGLLTVNAGIQLNGAKVLSTSEIASFSYGASATRFFVGDGTGYKFIFSQRVGGVTTDLATVFDTGALVLGTDPGGTQLLRVGGSGVFSGLLTASGGLTIASAQALKLGVAYVATPPTASGYVTLQDSTGTTYKVLVST